MNDAVRQPMCWIIKIWTTGEPGFKHPSQFKTFDEAVAAKKALDEQLQEDNIIRLYDEEKSLDLTINTNQVVSMKVCAVYEHRNEDEDRQDRSERQPFQRQNFDRR